MNSQLIAQVILLISVIGLVLSGVWLRRLSNLTSRTVYRTLGTALCWSGLLLLILGIIGLVR